MPDITLSTTLPHPPSAVWDELRHIERHVHWMEDAVAITFVGDQREGVGTSFRCATKIGPFTTTDVMTITRWEEGRAMGVEHRGLITGEGVFTLTGGEDATTMVWHEVLHFPWWMGGPLAELAAAPVLRWIWRKNLRNFTHRFPAAS
jgi:hypothetical protein